MSGDDWKGAPGVAGATDLLRRVDNLVKLEGGRRVVTADDEPDPGKRLGLRLIADIEPSAPLPLLLERLDPAGHSILFGMGDTGKSSIAAYWAVLLAQAGHRVLILDYEDHPEEWARRIHKLGGPGVVGEIAHMSPAGKHWQATRGALWDQADDIRQAAEYIGATYVVVDSIVTACGNTDPMKPEAAGQYARGLELIGLPVLSIAHVTKIGDAAYPFGSIFWHNLARVTWSAVKQPGEGHRVLLTHRKHNNYRKVPRTLLTMTYHDDVLADVMEEGYSTHLADEAWDAMGDDTVTVDELLKRMQEANGDDDPERGMDRRSVQTALRRGLEATAKRGKLFTKVDATHWKRA